MEVMESAPDRGASAEERWTWPSTGIPRAAWAIAALALAAVAIGAVMRGFLGTEWYWDANLLVEAIPPALPLAVGAAVVAGAFRWPASRSWLLAGAALFVARGILDVAGDTWIYTWTNFRGMPPAPVEEALMIARFVVAELSFIGGMTALAVGLWRVAPSRGATEGWRRAALALVAVVGAVGLIGDGAYVSASIRMLGSPPPLEMAYWLILVLNTGSATALAVAAVMAIPERHRLPEVTIAAGTMLCVAATAGLNWSIGNPSDPGVVSLVLVFARGAVVGLVVLAAGFAAARLFPARTG